jgi:competence protein ComEA
VGNVRDRLAALSRGELGAVIALSALTLGGAGLWYVRSLPRPVEIRAEPKPDPEATLPGGSVPLIVHVAGWVKAPGVYELGEGDRVVDALEAAGGPRRGAYLDALNLAAPLTDGQQVLVPKISPSGPAPPVPPGGSVPGTGPGTLLVNVNTASATELETLPGVGEVIAQRIVDHRTANGPFTSVDDLLDVSGIGEATLEEIRDLVTV